MLRRDSFIEYVILYIIITGVSSADKTAIVDKHNELRRLQSATDMQEMVSIPYARMIRVGGDG